MKPSKAKIVKLYLLLVIGTIFISCSKDIEMIKLTSPNSEIAFEVSAVDNNLIYSVDRLSEELIKSSKIEIFKEANFKILDYTITENSSSWENVWGQFSTVDNTYNQLTIDFISKEIEGKLTVRAYDDGVAYRFSIPEGKPETIDLLCEFNVVEECSFHAVMLNSTPIGPLSVDDIDNLTDWKNKINIPIVAETSKQTAIAILESDLYSATGFSTMSMKWNKDSKTLYSLNSSELSGKGSITPWRVILIGDQVGDLVVSTTPINLSAPSKVEDTSWIKPGKTLWDWRVHGYRTEDGFQYGINTDSYKRFIDFAAESNINYFLIDAAWYSSASKGKFKLLDELDLQKVIDYAKTKSVDLMIYYDRHHGEYGDKELFPYFSTLGMKGVKYGFMGNDAQFTRYAIEQSAESKLLVDFHDSPAPMTGVRRTLPNAITREYCHAQQDSRKAFTPEKFIKMALINAITGPLDMNNGNFDIDGINAGDRLKGPKKLNSYLTTVTSEAARTLIIFSGLVCLSDAPEAYKAKSDLFEFIKKQPSGKWDESRVLHSKIGEYITTARRAGKEWFIGSVISQKGGELDIDLDFLEKDVNYEVTLYEDAPDTHCRTNPEAYQVRTIKVTKGDVVKAIMAPGGGHCMWIRPE